MSTVTWGNDETIFAALQEAFAAAAKYGSAVMTTTISNACPAPGQANYL